jgi:hypothetical protein
MKDGRKHGFGKMDFADGSTYEGSWDNDDMRGNGTRNWGDGINYVGEFHGGFMHGWGKYTMFDGSVVEGRFEYDEFAGYS